MKTVNLLKYPRSQTRKRRVKLGKIVAGLADGARKKWESEGGKPALYGNVF